jgi:hypothetical protein
MEKISAQAHGRNSIRRNEAWWTKRVYDHNYRRFAGEFLDRQIMGLLSTSEQSIVRFIFDRTVAWCKDWEDICTGQFTEGAQRSDGSFAYRGTGLSKRAVQVTLKGLVKDGLVLRRDAQPRPGRRSGWQAYMLLEVWKFAELPRFEGVNIRFSAPYDKAGEVEICTPRVQNLRTLTEDRLTDARSSLRLLATALRAPQASRQNKSLSAWSVCWMRMCLLLRCPRPAGPLLPKLPCRC